MISSDEAARVAREAGLTLGDAAALRALADDVPAAERIAARFGASAGDDDERQLVRDLFGERTDVEIALPGETGDRQFVRTLFGRTDTTDTQE